MPLTTGVRLGPYEIVAPLGAGGMGEVYRARDAKLGRDVAIKVLPDAFLADRDQLARFEREARVLAALNHPHIAAIYGFEEAAPSADAGQAGVGALILELVEGPTLAERLKAGPVPVPEALTIARQIADALDAAHEKGIVHRDLKPANIKITPEGIVKVLDFGLAKATAGDGPPPDLSQLPTVTAAGTREGVILGTAAYMSPELARGTTLDKRTDIWSFGCVLYEMLTGRLAFVAATVSDTIVAILEREPDWRALPATTPAPVRHLLQRCLEKDRRQRLRDIGDARVELNEALGPPVTADTPIGHRQIRLRRAAAIALALSAAIVLIVAALVWRSPSVRPGVSDQVLRLSILPPAEASFMPGSGVEISPDGRFLAFVASTGGTPQLWIRPLDAPATRPLPGTEGAESPFWSPDSRYLAFFAESKLKKVAASGGPPQTICDAALGRGGTWSTTGTIAFTPRVGGVLHSVSAAGGVPVAISRFDTSRREDAHYWPHFLPDGRHVLYFARSADPEHNAIYLIDAEADLDAQPLRLVSGNSMAAYAAPGYLLFLSGETLVAQQFDERRLRLIGERVPVSDEVGSMGSMGQGYFSTSASGLLAHWGGDQSERRLTWMDRNSKVLGVVDAPGAYGSSRLSSDDRRAAVELVDPRTGTIGIWLLEFSRGVMSRFAVEARWDRSPVWSPSGEWIAFSSDRIAPFNLYRKATDAASTEERLTAVNRPQYPEDWSRDGRKTNSLRTSPFDETQGQFSPDGRYVAYTSNESKRADVYIQPFPTTGRRWQVSSGGGSQPRWRRDGKELFYVAPGGVLMAVPIVSSGVGLEVGAPISLFEHRVLAADNPIDNVYSYDVTADGQRFLLAVPKPGSEVPPITVLVNWAAGLKRDN